ncbi:MAG: UbiD family decarboxylase, partial [Anaerolineales bacterium]|nr:UbiD family decarboxylase [Anaerolineales bacterium]
MDIRAFLSWARGAGTLVERDQPVAPYLELARHMAALEGQPVLFPNLAGFPGWRAVSGVCARRGHFAAALGCTVSEVTRRMADALAAPEYPTVVGAGPCQDVVEPRVDLVSLPIPQYHPLDGGRYVTSAIMVINDPDYGRNVAFHRLMVLDERRLAVRLVEGRGTHTAFGKTQADMPVAIAVGCPLQALLAAAMSPAKG